MVAAAVNDGLCLLEFADRRALETELKDLERLLEARCLPGTTPVLDRLAVEVDEYFAGRRKTFDLPLIQPGTPFDQAAWRALLSVLYGSTVSYRDQAITLGRPEAFRAVGRANGRNRIAIVVPCHRLVSSDGGLTGYGGGVWRKRWLLDHEAGRLAVSGRRP